MIKHSKPIVYLILFLGINACVFAQVKTEEVTVIAAYEPSLSDVVKLNVNPEIPETEIDKPDLNYTVSPVKYNTFFMPEKISAARLSGEPLTKLYQSYIRAGFGNYTTPFAELYYNNLRSRNSNMGFYYKHHSSSGKIKDYAPAKFSDNILNLYGSRFLNNHILSADVQYKRNRINYYGFDPDAFLIDVDMLDDLLYQRYNVIKVDAAVKSDYTTSDRFNHGLDISYYNWSDYYNSMENGLIVKAHINRNIDLISLVKNENIGLETQLNYYNNSYLLNSSNAAVIAVKPQYLFSASQYRLNVGVNTTIEVGDNDYIHFFPIIEGRISIAEDVLTLYGSFTGGVERNNLYDIYRENPFINTALPLDFTTQNVAVKGGIKGNIASVFSFNLGGAFAEVDNMAFFVNDTFNIMQNRFTLSYHDVTVANAFADFSLIASDKLSFLLSGKFNYYALDPEEHAWHKPMLEGRFSTRYNLVDKILLNVEAFAQTKTYAKLYDPAGIVTPTEIKAFADFNLSLEYLYTKKISAFLNLNNLTGSRHYQWYNYPTQRFHLLAGITYAF